MNQVKQFVLSITILFGLSGIALATAPHPNYQHEDKKVIDVVTVLENVEKAGYISITEIKLEHNSYYLVHAFTKAGVKAKFLVDAMTGVVPAPSKIKHISALQAAQKVEAAGYHSIDLIKVKHDHFDINAVRSSGEPVKLSVDPVTGIVSVK